jgi:hypothetical protein
MAMSPLIKEYGEFRRRHRGVAAGTLKNLLKKEASLHLGQIP